MFTLIAAMSIWGSAPICAYDGYTAQCFYLSWSACESAIEGKRNQRCIPNPESE